jgi:hypothetical protein
MEIVFNKAAVRMLPAELNKATGLAAARENCGTEGSNPLPSSAESANFRFLSQRPSSIEALTSRDAPNYA